jgi:hypothetical protein
MVLDAPLTSVRLRPGEAWSYGLVRRKYEMNGTAAMVAFLCAMGVLICIVMMTKKPNDTEPEEISTDARYITRRIIFHMWLIGIVVPVAFGILYAITR